MSHLPKSGPEQCYDISCIVHSNYMGMLPERVRLTLSPGKVRFKVKGKAGPDLKDSINLCGSLFSNELRHYHRVRNGISNKYPIYYARHKHKRNRAVLLFLKSLPRQQVSKDTRSSMSVSIDTSDDDTDTCPTFRTSSGNLVPVIKDHRAH